jgi:gluconolactonase
MDLDRVDPRFDRIVAAGASLDQIAHGTYFGEGPVWDRRNKRFLWVDIIGDTIYQWTPGIGKSVLVHPSSHANGMTFDRQGRLTIAGWSRRTIWRIEHDGSFTTIAGLRRLIAQLLAEVRELREAVPPSSAMNSRRFTRSPRRRVR